MRVCLFGDAREEGVISMTKFRKILMMIGISLCSISGILLIGILFFPTTHLIIALTNTFFLPFVWGLFFIILSFLLKQDEGQRNIAIKKVIYVVLLILLLRSSVNDSLADSIRDIQSVITNDLYITEGEVIDTYIKRHSSNNINFMSSKDAYWQHIILNNDQQDEFVLMVENMEDYVFQQGQTYEIIALPNSQDILEYKKK